jgi:hypothetical protein
MNFAIDVFAGFQITEGIEFLITETTRSTWIVMGLLLILALIVRIKSRNWDPMKKPTGLQNAVEMAVDAWEKFYRSNANDTVMYLAPWVFYVVRVFASFKHDWHYGHTPAHGRLGHDFSACGIVFLPYTVCRCAASPKSIFKRHFPGAGFYFRAA